MPFRGSRDDVSARYTSDGVSIYRTNASSLQEHNRAHEASICSTVSTTYSSTVLGIDLDLQYDHPPVGCPSPTPVWFAECQATQPSSRRDNDVIKSPHSITSSALPALLPLAVASGIVHANHATPQASFLSPSGNVIQVVDSLSPVSDSSHENASPVTNCQNMLSSHVSNLPARPAVLPSRTRPASTAPLPLYLRHHRYYHHAAHSHIVPQPRMSIDITSTSAKGCGGVVRMRNLPPWAETKQLDAPEAHKQSNRYTSCSNLAHLSKLNFNRAASCAHLRPFQSPNGIVSGQEKPVSVGMHARTQSRKHYQSFFAQLNPFFGRVARKCLCQPWDSDGGTNPATGADSYSCLCVDPIHGACRNS